MSVCVLRNDKAYGESIRLNSKKIEYIKETLIRVSFARGQGFEPRLPGPEPGVLPLDDPRIYKFLFYIWSCRDP